MVAAATWEVHFILKWTTCPIRQHLKNRGNRLKNLFLIGPNLRNYTHTKKTIENCKRSTNNVPYSMGCHKRCVVVQGILSHGHWDRTTYITCHPAIDAWTRRLYEHSFFKNINSLSDVDMNGLVFFHLTFEQTACPEKWLRVNKSVFGLQDARI